MPERLLRTPNKHLWNSLRISSASGLISNQEPTARETPNGAPLRLELIRAMPTGTGGPGFLKSASMAKFIELQKMLATLYSVKIQFMVGTTSTILIAYGRITRTCS